MMMAIGQEDRDHDASMSRCTAHNGGSFDSNYEGLHANYSNLLKTFVKTMY